MYNNQLTVTKVRTKNADILHCSEKLYKSLFYLIATTVCYSSCSRIKSLISTSNTLTTCNNISKLGCAAFVHHFETVAGSLPTYSASHLLVLPFSASITLIRLIFLLAISLCVYYVLQI